MSEMKRILETIFHKARNLASPEERRDYLDKQCGDDVTLRQQVEELLAANADMGKFLDETLEGERDSLVPEALGTTIGRYKLLQVIGEGGMGVVYMAQQDKPVQRKVALKIIKLGMDTKEFVARFEAERQALAMMDHPNIARALDAGATETGRPYFVMELVQGISITDFCERSKLPTEQRLKLFIDVCRAVQSAHQKGIIHRDIKPSNVLVTLHHGEPMPKVIDFGVAKAVNLRLTEKTYFTRFATMIGTPAYMSPEQAKMSSMDVDTRTDVYSLGVLLYRLLTGSTPFSDERLRSAAFDEMQRIIVEEEPDRPSTRLSTSSGNSQSEGKTPKFDSSLARDLKGELDWIMLKCLEKDRGRRYGTPNELAADVRRFLDEEPVLAVAPTFAYQLKKLYQRNKTVARLSGLLLMALVVGLCVSIWQWREAGRARDVAGTKTKEAIVSLETANTEKENARQAERDMETALYQNSIIRARLETESGNADRSNAALDQCPKEQRGWEWELLKQRADSSMTALRGHTSEVRDVACSPDGKWIASAGGGLARGAPDLKYPRGVVIIWNARTGRRTHTLDGHSKVIWEVAFSPDSQIVASASGDGWLRLWDVKSGKQLKEYYLDQAVSHVAFSPDGKYLAAGSPTGRTWVWTRSSDERHDVPILKNVGNLWVREAIVTFDSESKTLYSGNSENFHAWDIEGQKVRVFDQGAEGGMLLTTPLKTGARFWNTATGKNNRWLRLHRRKVTDVVLNPVTFVPEKFGDMIRKHFGQFATCDNDGTIRVWTSFPGGNAEHSIGEFPRNTLLGHIGPVVALDYTPDGNRLVSGGADGTVRIWDLSRNLWHADVPLVTRVHYGRRVYALAFNEDSNKLSLALDYNDVLTINPTTHTPLGVTKVGTDRGPDFCLDSMGTVAVGKAKGATTKVICWDLVSGRERLTLNGHTAPIHYVVCTANAKRVATSSGPLLRPGEATNLESWDGKTGEVKVWDGETGNVLFEVSEPGLSVSGIAVSPGGGLVAVSCNQLLSEATEDELQESHYSIRVYEVDSGKMVKAYDDIQEPSRALAFDRTGNRLAAAGMDQPIVVIWNLSNDQLIKTTQALKNATSLAFRPGGRRLAIANMHHTKVLDTDSGNGLLVLQNRAQAGLGASFSRVCWSHDGLSLAVGSGSSYVSVWSIPDPRQTALNLEERIELAKKRAISHRLQIAHCGAIRAPNISKNRFEYLRTLKTLGSAFEHRIRQEIYKKLKEPEKAAADKAEAERLEQLQAQSQ